MSEFRTDTLTDEAVMLMGFQRTRQISNAARKAWEAGDRAPMAAEAQDRRAAIIAGTLAEIEGEYRPVRDWLNAHGLRPTHVADIGCGTGLNDLFLARDFAPRITLIDIEETPEQYHGWKASGSGYASLAAARALLEANGAREVTVINPRKTPEALAGLAPDLATSLLSCGFHYPVDAYLDLFLDTLARGGAVVLDLRRRYLRQRPEGLARLLDAGEATELFTVERATRVAIRG